MACRNPILHAIVFDVPLDILHGFMREVIGNHFFHTGDLLSKANGSKSWSWQTFQYPDAILWI